MDVRLKGFLGQVVFAQSLEKQIVIVNALAAADDFAVAFRGDHVESEGELGTLGVRLHVKSLHRRRVMMNEDGTIEFPGDDGFFVSAEVISEFGGVACLVEHSN